MLIWREKKNGGCVDHCASVLEWNHYILKGFPKAIFMRIYLFIDAFLLCHVVKLWRYHTPAWFHCLWQLMIWSCLLVRIYLFIFVNAIFCFLSHILFCVVWMILLVLFLCCRSKAINSLCARNKQFSYGQLSDFHRILCWNWASKILFMHVK